VPSFVVENLNGWLPILLNKNLYVNPLMNFNVGFLTLSMKYFPPASVTETKTKLSLTNETLLTFKVPVISVFVLILRPSTFEIDAVALPSAILVKLSPVTPLAGILYNPDPSPIKEPVNAPVV
jgi:hypothetical protein